MPLDNLQQLFRCSKCGNRNLQITFLVPDQPDAQAAE
jgi:hypothetical protein